MGSAAHNKKSISYWRNRLFTNIITFFLPGSLIALLPGVYMSVATGHTLIGIADVGAALLILFTTLNKRISITARKVCFITVLYCLSIVLIFSMSLLGPALVYLLALSVLASVILPNKWGYVTAFINSFICIACACCIYFQPFQSALNNHSLGTWIAVSSNLVFLSFVMAMLIGHAFAGFEKTLKKEVLLNDERLKTLKNLRYSEQSLIQAQALAHFGSWELSFDTGIATWSEEACRIYGLTPENNKHSYQNWLAFIHPDDLPHVIEETRKARKTLSKADFYHRIVWKNGTIRHLHSQAQYEFDEDGKVISINGVAHDITEIKKNQEEIRKSNERFELVNQAAKEAILDWDIVNDVTYWGNGFTEMFRYHASQYHNNLLSDNIHPEDRQRVLDGLHSLLTDPENTHLFQEFRFLRADRSIAHVQLRSVFIRDNNGKAIRAVASILDITELVEKQKAIEQQNAALREITWTQSHVVRSPLATLMGLVDLLKNKEEYGINEKELIENIQSVANTLDSVVHDVVRKAEKVEFALQEN